MFKSLRLVNFKNFRDTTVPLSPFTVLVGTNAAGKSNVGDALRFLHGVGRGYSLAEGIGGKWGHGGERTWPGVRGGTREIARRGTDEFLLAVTLDHGYPAEGVYSIETRLAGSGRAPAIVSEQLSGAFEVRGGHARLNDPFVVRWDENEAKGEQEFEADPNWPILPMVGVTGGMHSSRYVRAWSRAFRGTAFLEPSSDAMREPSTPGAQVLGERGENLSSVLAALCADPQRKADILEWTRQLTPIDVTDFEFPQDFAGRILLHLLERDGGLISAQSASDGTLRFLALVAAMFGGGDVDAGPSSTLFIEDLDAGIHPTRLHLLVDLIEQQTRGTGVQVIATTHSPALLRLLSKESQQNAVLIYRDPRDEGGGACQILNVPKAVDALRANDIAQLLASGWLESAVCVSGASNPDRSGA